MKSISGHPLHQQVGYVYDSDTDKVVPQKGVEDDGAPYVLLKVWSVALTDWVKMTQPALELTGDLTVTMGDVEALLADNYWKIILVDNTTGNIDYIGKHTVAATAQGTATWHVWRYADYSGGLARDVQGPLVRSWTGRAAAGWV